MDERCNIQYSLERRIRYAETIFELPKIKYLAPCKTAAEICVILTLYF